jgi:NADH:ubiquinone oxidoreductase subunit 2 (subunit N)
MSIDWIIILPQILLAAGGFFIFCVGAFRKHRSSGSLFGMALIAVILAGGATIFTAPGPSQFAGMVEGAGYGRFFTFIITLITGIHMDTEKRKACPFPEEVVARAKEMLLDITPVI